MNKITVNCSSCGKECTTDDESFALQDETHTCNECIDNMIDEIKSEDTTFFDRLFDPKKKV